MKIGNILTTNAKGQIVIPKEMRKALNINPGDHLHAIVRGGGAYLFPIKEVIHKGESESSYRAILKKTLGAWKDGPWENTRKKRNKIEIIASKRRKQTW